MLTHLSVHNFALIDHLELDLAQGFTVITGETGAGKSILLGALNLILGKRADLSTVRQQDKKCVIEGTFKVSTEFESFFAQNDLDYDGDTILRREISPSGKSRAFINDTPVTLDVLESLAKRLIDVHSQHQNLLLTDTLFQLQLLDSFAGNQAQRIEYSKALKVYKVLLGEKEKITQHSENESGDSDYLQFLFEELQSAKLKGGEQEELENELLLLENSSEINEHISGGIRLLDEDQHSILNNLQELSNTLSAILKYDEGLKPIIERVNSSRIDMDDIRSELEERASGSEYDPARAELLDQRLTELISLQRKHQVESVEELIEKMNNLEDRITFISGLEDTMAQLDEKIEASLKDLELKAKALHKSRKKIIPGLQKQIEGILAKLNMKSARFSIDLQPDQPYNNSGYDKVDFLFSANPGKPEGRLSKVASGGELSRVMLALKAIMAKTQNLPSIIFDEIDTGVSGETAGKIGEILKDMGSVMQVITITHLPQIASMSQAHLKVEKSSTKNNTYSTILTLNAEERVYELARLLSGEKITDAALNNAKELLFQN